ncbi:DUF2252 family protein [Alkalinema sp. FACHB-956]|uniref:DUF2252 domain-containing protein n=1 Tax=Alkalinema sp. FACHB-956 TaxID=2692768 RepID=UPI0016824B5B|nr:DUF2252 family protein [Alkalinema sp. FACHB-956]MBD2328823.1 DUF2252 domain-containing protein [Alkalinema sp. FACHB-956]
MVREVIARIQAFNQGRIPELVQRKYAAMAEDPLAFLRGTCHLFYEDLTTTAASPLAELNAAPLVWICGDLHLQNFGSFKGDDRLVYFDINDFDEGILAPCTWDLVRFVTSIRVAGQILGLDLPDIVCLCQAFLTAYTAAISAGKARTIHRETATGLVDDLLESLRKRKRADFLRDRTEKGKSLRLIPNKVTPVSPETCDRIRNLIQTWAATQTNPEFFEVLDVAHRIAGNGSLGVERYLILVAGQGSAKTRYLLDLKAARSSSLQSYVNPLQPQWTTEAERVVALQTRFQESPPALLNALSDGKQSYTLRELQPTADKVDLTASQGKVKKLTKVIRTMAEVTAWGQLRSGGRQGSAIADDLIQFAQSAADWQPQILHYAEQYATQVEQDYGVFRDGYAAGALTR